MTGTFKLQLLYNKKDQKCKWIVRKRNIGEKYFGGLLCFTDNQINALLNNTKDYNTFVTLFTKDYNIMDGRETNWSNRSLIYPTDTFRKMTVQEYMNLAKIFKHYNLIYNKKKDEFRTTK